MMHGGKREFPALLSVGFHKTTEASLRQLCVTNFPLSNTRPPIMIGLERLIDELRTAGIVGEVWVDGSFMTGKVDPADADIVLCAHHTVYDNGTVQQKILLDSVGRNLRSILRCDSYTFYEYPQGHNLHPVGEWMRAYWTRQYGFSRGDAFKGIAVIEVP